MVTDRARHRRRASSTSTPFVNSAAPLRARDGRVTACFASRNNGRITLDTSVRRRSLSLVAAQRVTNGEALASKAAGIRRSTNAATFSKSATARSTVSRRHGCLSGWISVTAITAIFIRVSADGIRRKRIKLRLGLKIFDYFSPFNNHCTDRRAHVVPAVSAAAGRVWI